MHPLPMIPLPFPLKKTDCPLKPIAEGEKEEAQEIAPKCEDSESEDEEAKRWHNQSPLESMSQRITELAKILW